MAHPDIHERIEELTILTQDLRALNAIDASRSRELSLAITKLEEAKHWLVAILS